MKPALRFVNAAWDNKMDVDITYAHKINRHIVMGTYGRGRTWAASAVSRETHARRLLAALLDICRQLRLAQKDREARRAYRAVEEDLVRLARKRRKSTVGRVRK